MSVDKQLWLFFFTVVFGYFGIYRSFLWGLKTYQLNKNAYKKRKKGETFREWLFYSRYEDVFPKELLIVNRILLAEYPICFCVWLFFYFAGDNARIGEFLLIVVCVSNILGFWVLGVLFRSIYQYGFKYERWIKKRRGMPPPKGKKEHKGVYLLLGILSSILIVIKIIFF